MFFDSPNNYYEDFAYENGKYYHNCKECKHPFIGHKRRVICKVCGDRAAEEWEKMSQEKREKILTDTRKEIISFYANRPN